MDRAAENYLREVICNSIADGVFTVDENWRITTFNCAAARITGVPQEEAVGMSCCDVFRASICEGECALRESMQSGRAIINKAIYITDSTGSRVPVSISTAALKDESGEVIGGVETFRDLSIVEELRRELHDKYTFSDIIGRSHAMRQLFDILPQIAESDSTVLLAGDSGTGKELFARAIHNLSSRKDKPFIAVNCGALPDSLLGSELFGHKAGAFTDARQDKPGRFALADGGTILLDEIGDISPAMQVRLLRVLQERVIEPLGGIEPVPVDVRVIAATNKDLTALLHEGSFREDLYYRVNVVRLELPPLSARREDIPLLIEHFVAKFNRLKGKDVSGISEEGMTILLSHGYPGNVRELENIIEHAFALCQGGIIGVRHLPPWLRPEDKGDAPEEEHRTLRAMERVMIQDAIRRHQGNRKAAARELGIDPSTLYRKAAALDIRLPGRDGRTQG